MICSGPGVGDADGATDLPGAAGLLAVGADHGAGFWPKACAASRNEMAVAAARFNIALIVSWSPRREQYRADNDHPRPGGAIRLHNRGLAPPRWLTRAQ